jgi:hypothetical protein
MDGSNLQSEPKPFEGEDHPGITRVKLQSSALKQQTSTSDDHNFPFPFQQSTTS